MSGRAAGAGGPGANPAVVGGFVLGALALGVAAILFFGGSRLLERTARAVIYFEGSVAGLDVGAPVTFRGVRVGAVQRVELQLSAAGQARIPVTVELLPGQVTVVGRDARRSDATLENLVDAGLRAQLNLQSFVTGQLRVDLDFRPGTPADLVPDADLPQIPAVPSDIERLRATLQEAPVQDVVQAAQRTLAAVERVATRLDADFGPLLEGALNGMGGAGRTLEAAERAITLLQTEAAGTLRELNGLLAEARRQLDGRGEEFARVLGTADRVGRQAEAVLGALEGLTSPRARLRGDLEAAARDLAAGAASLRGFARAVERDPSAILRGGRTR